MKLRRTPLLSFIVMVTVAGCATNNKSADTSAVTNQSASIQLAEAAQSVSQSLQSLAAIEMANHPDANTQNFPNPASYGMDGLTSIDWSGPIEPIVKRIADATNYKFRVLGHAPAAPVLVNIAARNTPIGTVLRDIGLQCGQQADIVVYPKTRIIELRYKRA